MANRLQKTPATKYIPGQPGQPPIPAYCVDEPIYSDYGAYASNLQLQQRLTQLLTQQKLGATYYGQVGVGVDGKPVYGPKTVAIPEDISSMFAGAGASGVFVWQYLRVCYPAKPAVPSVPPRVVYDSLPGWNSGGISIGGFSGDGYVEFQIGPSTIGAIVGINTRSDTVSPADCSHALYGHQGLLHVFEDGALVYAVPGGLTGNPKLRIARAGGVVKYLVNDVVVYTSAKTSIGYARLDASLYLAGDYVDNPLLAGFNYGQAVGSVGVTAFIDPRPRATGYVGVSGSAQGAAGAKRYGAASGAAGAKGTATGHNVNTAQPVALIGVSGSALPAPNVAVGTIRPATGLASEGAYAQAAGVFRGGYIGDAVGGFPEVNVAYAIGYGPLAQGQAFCISGGVANAAASIAPAQGVAGENGYAQAVQTYRGGYFGIAYAPWLSPDSAEFGEVVLLRDSFTASAAVLAEFRSILYASDKLEVLLELEAGFEWFDALMAADTIAELSDRTADMRDVAYLTDRASSTPLLSQLATNTVSGAPTEYSGMDFLRLLHTKHGSYTIRPDGLYKLGAYSDEPPLRALIDFGAQNFQTLTPKHLNALFFGLRTDGQVFAVVRGDKGADRVYRVVQREKFMRANPAKGLTAKFWRVRLEIADASFAELDSVEFFIDNASRRWTR